MVRRISFLLSVIQLGSRRSNALSGELLANERNVLFEAKRVPNSKYFEVSFKGGPDRVALSYRVILRQVDRTAFEARKRLVPHCQSHRFANWFCSLGGRLGDLSMVLIRSGAVSLFRPRS